jgi:flagellar protein FlaF
MMNQGAKKAGYVSQPAATDPRSTEAWALSEASRRLVVGAKTDDGGKSLRDALILNQRLWTIFQTSITEPDCPLPREIRDNVLALSIMMDRQILQRLGDLDGSKLQPILDINRCVAEGLAMKPEVPVAQAVQGAPAHPQPIPAAPAVGGTRMAVNVSA